MDAWIDFARGPLFRIALTVFVLGLAYRIVVTVAQMVAAWRRAGDRRVPYREAVSATVSWLLPLRLLRTRPAYSVASFTFHLGVVLVPLFLAGHVGLLGPNVAAVWPTFSPLLADTLTVVAILALAVLLVGRIVTRSARGLTRAQDVLILLLLGATLALGFLAAHPALSPFAARTMLLGHILCGNLILVLAPLTKIAHCAIYPFTHLLFQLGWHFPAATGQHVAIALNKEDEPI